ncbi:DUF222 domain-containing protein [Amycolatopsis cihanbeyliensis]|uniref:DUF222 domain-containing protein n=1 Tax=Amycolatopsis cihanbeyliensis TaxID=1128664 RepID=UPI001B869210|nr:DUF222 domain-containing protein [Amycolatopsis cihanbeyliensis]
MSRTFGIDTSRMGEEELLAALGEIEQQRRGLYARELAVLAELDGRTTAARKGYRDVAALAREILRINAYDARQRVAHARAVVARYAPTGAPLEPDLPDVGTALAEGAIGPEHVEAIRATVARFPQPVSLPDREHAEELLTKAAREYEPHTVTALGREIVARLDQDGNPPTDEDLVRPARFLDWRDTRNGRLRGNVELDVETAALLTGLIEPRAKPHGTNEEPDRRGKYQRQGDAFAEVLRVAAGCPEDGPTEAGEPFSVMVSVTLDDRETRHRIRADQRAGIVSGGADPPDGLRCLYRSRRTRQQGRDPGHRAEAPHRTPGHPAGPDPARQRVRLPRLPEKAEAMRRAPCCFLGQRRPYRTVQPRTALPFSPQPDPPHGVGSPDAQRAPRIHPTRLPRPGTKTQAQPPPPPRKGGRMKLFLVGDEDVACSSADAPFLLAAHQPTSGRYPTATMLGVYQVGRGGVLESDDPEPKRIVHRGRPLAGEGFGDEGVRVVARHPADQLQAFQWHRAPTRPGGHVHWPEHGQRDDNQVALGLRAIDYRDGGLPFQVVQHVEAGPVEQFGKVHCDHLGECEGSGTASQLGVLGSPQPV